MMSELKEAYELKYIPEGSTLSLDMINELLTRMELRLETLEKEVEATKKISPNPAKKQRRTLKSQKRKLFKKKNKLLEHENQLSIYGTRNSYSKTNHDATFMRVKEDHMRSGQLKPAYNLTTFKSQPVINLFLATIFFKNLQILELYNRCSKR